MDLKAYYRRIREQEAALEADFVVMKSLATESGGKEGVLTEVARAVGAQMIVDGKAEIASAKEAESFRAAKEEARAREAEQRRASQIQFSVISEADLAGLMRGSRGRKE